MPEEIISNSESLKAISVALAKAHLAFKPIIKSSKVDYATSSGRKQYSYAPLSEVIEATKEALSANELALIQFTKLVEGNVILITLLAHSSGEWVAGELYVGRQDQPPQSEGSSLTYKRRYGMSAMLGVASEEDDDAETATKTLEGVKREATDGHPVEHWCEEHKAVFFKRGKMRAYAHPIEGTDPPKWCDEVKPIHTVEQVAREMAEAATSTPTTPVASQGQPPLIDLVSLRESLQALEWVDVGLYLKGTYNVTGQSISAMVKQLSPGQSQEFAEEVQRRLKELRKEV